MLVGRSVLRRCLNGAFQGMVCDDDEILFEFQAARMHQATNMRNYMTEPVSYTHLTLPTKDGV